MQKITKNPGFKGVHQRLDVTLKGCLYCSVSDWKSCFSIRKSISTSEQRAVHQFAGQNTQQAFVVNDPSGNGVGLFAQLHQNNHFLWLLLPNIAIFGGYNLQSVEWH